MSSVHEWLSRMLDLHGEKVFMVQINVIDEETNQLTSESYCLPTGQEDTTVIPFSSIPDPSFMENVHTTLDLDV